MKRATPLLALLLLPLVSASLFADEAPATPTLEQLWDIIQAQQAEIERP